MSSEQERYELFATELLRWNKTHSLTAIRDKEGVMQNIKDSIYPLGFVDDFGSCLDIGSGAGFPAIPLAIVKERVEFYLAEPNIKKCGFLNYIKAELGLDNVKILNCRVEDAPIKRVDLISSRAVSRVDILLELAAHIETKALLFYKGSKVAEEMEQTSGFTIKQNREIRYLYKRLEAC